MSKIRVGLVGIGGYGAHYVNALLREGPSQQVELVGTVDPFPAASPGFQDLEKKKVPIFSSLEELYSKNTIDLLILATPIQFHAEQGIYGMEQGSHILCEKPVVATIQDGYQLLKIREGTKRLFAVGFQWAYDPVFQQVKLDLQRGMFGKPRRLSSVVLWPRNASYYARWWAGRLKDAEERWVLDSVVNNATAHFLHAMLHLLGKEENQAAFPKKIVAELYRANPIENFDTFALQAEVEGEVTLCFFASHAVEKTLEPRFLFDFEEGTMFYNDPEVPQSMGTLVYRPANSRAVKVYGRPDHQSLRKLWVVVDAIRASGSIPCSLESALSHTLCINGAQDSVPEIPSFPKSWMRQTGHQILTFVEGLQDVLFSCHHTFRLPS